MKIFICYRREDSQHQAGRMYDLLEPVFGSENIFKDVDSMPVGVDFRVVLRDSIANCDAVLVLIGDHWEDVRDDAGRWRIDDAGDFVRLEIECALSTGIPVVPVLVGNAPMPAESDLPVQIRGLAYRHGILIRPDPFFRGDIGKLATKLQLFGAKVDHDDTKEDSPEQDQTLKATLQSPKNGLKIGLVAAGCVIALFLIVSSPFTHRPERLYTVVASVTPLFDGVTLSGWNVGGSMVGPWNTVEAPDASNAITCTTSQGALTRPLPKMEHFRISLFAWLTEEQAKADIDFAFDSTNSSDVRGCLSTLR